MFRTGRLALAPCLLAGWWLHLHLGPHLILLTLWVMVPDTQGVRPSVHPFDQAPIEGVFDLVGIQPTRRALDPELVSPFRWQQHGKQEGAVTEWSQAPGALAPASRTSWQELPWGERSRLIVLSNHLRLARSRRQGR